jgi:hypothetical protein
MIVRIQLVNSLKINPLNCANMKPLYLTVLLLIVTSFLYAQNSNTTNPFAAVEMGSKTYYNIKLQNNSVIKARVVSVDPNQVLLLLPGGESMTVPTKEVVLVSKQSYNSYGSVGVGFGIPYGMLGANLDLKLVSVLYATGGIGTGIYVTPMYNIGLKCFLRSGNYKFRPRVMAGYGTTSMLNIEDNSGNTVEKGSLKGMTVAAGFQWALNITKTVAFDCDVVYILDDSEFEGRLAYYKSQGYNFDIESSGNFKVSVGLRYIF